MLRSHREGGLEGEKPPGTPNNDQEHCGSYFRSDPKRLPSEERCASLIRAHSRSHENHLWCKLLDFIMV